MNSRPPLHAGPVPRAQASTVRSIVHLELPLREVIEHYLLDHEKAMMSAIAGALAIPSVKDPATASPGAPFGVDIARALRYVLDITNWMGFPSENVEGVVGRARFGDTSGIEYAVLTHVDVVPAGDGWTLPPFAATIRDGRLYGRGAVDDKGPAIATVFALAAARAALAASGVEPKNAILLMFGTDEECTWQDDPTSSMLYLAMNVRARPASAAISLAPFL